jgi:hypothetical protein
VTTQRQFRLRSGEVVRLDEDGRLVLVSAPSGARKHLEEMAEGQYLRAWQMRQRHRERIEARRQSLDAAPAVPPEKRPV